MIFIYDGSFEGFLSAVFDAYYMKVEPTGIYASSEDFQTSLGEEIYHSATEETKSDRLLTGMHKKIGKDFADTLLLAFLSWMPKREITLYKYIVMGFKLGIRVLSRLTDDTVRLVNDMARQTGREAHLLKGFARFSVLENDAMYAEISPKSNCLPFIMPHFSDRMRTIPFLIHDKTHNLVGFSDTREWFIRSSDGLSVPHFHSDEMKYRRMWKCFYDTIAIEARINPALRDKLMPKRYQKHIIEMNDSFFLDVPENTAPALISEDASELPSSQSSRITTPKDET